MERRTPLKRTPFKRPTSPKVPPSVTDPPEFKIPGYKGLKQRKAINPISKTKARRREQAAGPSMADLRPLLWKRCGGRCEKCNRALDYETFDAHHRKYRSRGGLDRIENLVALCQECHAWAHKEGGTTREAALAGFAISRTREPWEVSLNLGPRRTRVYLTRVGTYSTTRPEGSHA